MRGTTGNRNLIELDQEQSDHEELAKHFEVTFVFKSQTVATGLGQAQCLLDGNRS